MDLPNIPDPSFVAAVAAQLQQNSNKDAMADKKPIPKRNAGGVKTKIEGLEAKSELSKREQRALASRECRRRRANREETLKTVVAEQAAQIEELTAALDALRRENAMITGAPVPEPMPSNRATLGLPQSPMMSISSAPSPLPPSHMTSASGHLAPMSTSRSPSLLTADAVAQAAASALSATPQPSAAGTMPHSPNPTSTASRLEQMALNDPSQTAASIMTAAVAAASNQQTLQQQAHQQLQQQAIQQTPAAAVPLLPPQFLNGEPQVNSLGSAMPQDGASFEVMRVPAAVQEQAVRNMEAFLSNLTDNIGTLETTSTTEVSTFGVGPSFVIPTTDAGGMAPAVPSGQSWDTSGAGAVLPGPGLYNPDLSSLMDDGEDDSGAGVGL